MTLPVVASETGSTPKFRSGESGSNLFSSHLESRHRGCFKNEAPKEQFNIASAVFVAAATVSTTPRRHSTAKVTCRRAISSPITRENSSSKLTSRVPQRKYGETRIRWKEDDQLVQNLAPKKSQGPVSLHHVAAAKILGRTWQQRHQQKVLQRQQLLQQQQPVKRTFSNQRLPEPILTTAPKKKYKKKKHSLSSPSLGKYSPMLLRKVFQNQQKDPLVEVTLNEDEEFEVERPFTLWASETETTRTPLLLHGEERMRGGQKKREDFFEDPFSRGLTNSRTLHASASSCSLAVEATTESHLSVPVVPKKKKKSIISSLSLGHRDLPKKLVAAQQSLTISTSIWNRRQAVKKSRQSIASFGSSSLLLLPEAVPEVAVVPVLKVAEPVVHCTNTECCCHARKYDDSCSLCREPETPRKKSSFFARLSSKHQQQQQKLRNMLVGKTNVRMNSEPLLGRRTAANKKHSTSMESTSSNGQTQPPPVPPRTGLVPRRDFGPAASNPRPPMLRFSRGSWVSKPVDEKPAPEPSKKFPSLLSKSTRRHSAPPVSARAMRKSSVTFLNTMSVNEVADQGTINRHVWKIVKNKQLNPVDLSQTSSHLRSYLVARRKKRRHRRKKKRRRRCCWCGRHKDSVIDEVGEDINLLEGIRKLSASGINEMCPWICTPEQEPIPRPIIGSVIQIADPLLQFRSIWLACVCDLSIPDPAYDRKLGIYWMDHVDRIYSRQGKKQTMPPDSRYILRRLDRFLAFPEESALMLRDFEANLLGSSSLLDLLSGVTHNLTKDFSNFQEQALKRFHKIICHFYLVSEWIVHVIISQGTRSGRRSVLNCLLRLAQVSWNIGNLNAVMEILLGLRSPALKPLWLSFTEGEPEAFFFSNLFKKFFSLSSKGYHEQVKRFEQQLIRKQSENSKSQSENSKLLSQTETSCGNSTETSSGNIDTIFVPAFLLHITELAFALQSGHSSSIVNMDHVLTDEDNNSCQNNNNNNNKQCDLTEDKEPLQVPTVTLLSDFKGENRFIQRIGPDGLVNPTKLKRFQSSIELADRALGLQHKQKVRTYSSSLRRKPLHFAQLSGASSCLDLLSTTPRTNVPHHNVIISDAPSKMDPTVEVLHRGTTVLYLESETHLVTSILLKLEPCNGTITWCRPPWTDPRKMFGSPTSNEIDKTSAGTGVSSSNPNNSPSTTANGVTANGQTIDTLDGNNGNAVSPGLRLKYTNRSGESLAYSDEGYIDLTHVKNLSLIPNIVAYPEEVRVQAQHCFQGVVEPRVLRIVYGSTLADNKILSFICPPKVALAWLETLRLLTQLIKTEDPRMVWLKNQYLFLYYQDDLCMGPLAADAIKVFGGRSWSLTGMLKDRGNKGSWKGGQNPRLKKKSYGNIYTINDRGIHEIFESFGGSGVAGGNSLGSGLAGASAPTSPWGSPKMGRKSVVTMAPSIDRLGGGKTLSSFQQLDNFSSDDNGKLKTFRTGSVTHGSELTFTEFLDLFKSFSLRLRNDIRTLFANHSVCNAISPEGVEKDVQLLQEKLNASCKEGKLGKQKAFLCSLTRNSSIDLKDFKNRSDKKKIYDAISAASIFHNVAGEATSRTRVIPIDAFLHFLGHFQKEHCSDEAAKKLVEMHEPDPVLRSRHQLSFEGFARYLMDGNNSAVQEDPGDEDLDQPLSRYYIATSHNTYLSGHQLKGQSSVQLYREILLSGCRCVELDCWDGDDGQPIIYHGHTLTTKISFREVVQTISTYAFVTSQLPVILSIENRCSVGQQQKMAAIFKELLGDRLVTSPLSEQEPWLPSPNQLRNRFILKNKKIRFETGLARGSLYRASTLDDSVEVDEEYDSDFGEEHFDDEIGDDVIEQNLTAEEFHRQSVRRPRTLSISPSMQLTGSANSLGPAAKNEPATLATPYQVHRSSVFAGAAPTSSSVDLTREDFTSGMTSAATGNAKQQKKLNLQIAQELSDLIIYCQSVKFKGFRKAGSSAPVSGNNEVASFWTSYTDSPATRRRVIIEMSSSSSTSSTQFSTQNTASALRKSAAVKSGETTPFSSTGSLSSLPNNSRLAAPTPAASGNVGGSGPGQYDVLTNPIYQCMSLPESRAKTLCRKQPQRMLEHTELQLVRVYPAGMRIDSSNFNPIPFWSCGIQMAAMNYQTITDANMHLHNAFFSGTQGYVLRPSVTWNPGHVLYQRFLPSSKSQDGLHPTNITLTIVSGQYVCRENYAASPIIEIEVIGLPRDCCKYKTKMASRNALNPIWEETFELEISLPHLAFLRFHVIDVASNTVTAQRIVPVGRLRPGYRHLRLHNEQDQPLPLSQLFLCSQIDSDVYSVGNDGKIPDAEQLARKRMSFLVVHDINDATPYAILKVHEDATTRDVIRQAVAKAGANSRNDHDYVLLEEMVSPTPSQQQQQQQRMVGMEEMPLQVRKVDTKFVLRKVGQDPSWRARLGNLMSDNNRPSELESQQSREGGGTSSKEDSFEYPDENEEIATASDNNNVDENASGNGAAISKRNNADQFLVCVFNVSSKVSYSILQVPKTSTAFDVISMALHKSRRDEKERPENFSLVEETDSSGGVGASGSSKGSSTKRHRRALDPKENVYIVTLSWKGAGRLVLEEKTRPVLSSSHSLHPNAFETAYHLSAHASVCETQSDPIGGASRLSPGGISSSKMSPNLRRHSRNIVSNVRKFSRSFYGGSSASQSVEVTTVNRVEVARAQSSDTEIPTVSVSVDPDHVTPTCESVTSSSSLSPPLSRSNSRKISKINLKKLKIW